MEDILKDLLEKAGKKGKVTVVKGKIPLEDEMGPDVDEEAEEVKEEAAMEIASILGLDEDVRDDFMDALERYVMACY